jgi:hypothetical protein
MAIKIYQKRGNLNYKERKLISEIEQSIVKKFGDTPPEKFNSATNFDQLKELHNMYCGDEVDFVEIKNGEIENEETHKNFRDNMKAKTESDFSLDDIEESDKTFIDPLNREEPLVRDYVMNGDPASTQDSSSNSANPKLSFDEPLTFEDSFDIPGESSSDKDKRNNTDSKNNQTHNARPINNQNNQSQNSGMGFNGGGQNSDIKKQRKSSQRFAKYIVSTVCMLCEKGFVWYANSDINDSKLAEYELSGEIDLSILVTLEGGQEATIKQFFQAQSLKAEELAVISKEEQEDLTDAVAELLLEKNFTPTPTQEVLLISLKIIGAKFVGAFALKSQTNDLLMQLRSMKAEQTPQQEYKEPQPQPRPQPQPQAQAEPVEEPIDEEAFLLDKEIQTIE